MIAPHLAAPIPELWLGVECTVNRVGDTYSDQLERSGHAIRIKALERQADLGVRTIRYPILWERTAPEPTLFRVNCRWHRLRSALRPKEIEAVVAEVFGRQRNRSGHVHHRHSAGGKSW